MTHFGRMALALAIAVLLGPSIVDADSPTTPNIVIIISDDQGSADVSYNPHHPKEVHTPNIDALARASVICNQGYTTGFVCSPTRAGLMTGQYQQRFGVYTAGEGGSGVPLTETFLVEYLKRAGYVTGAFGKWHLGLTLEYNAVNRGFDEFYGFMGRGAHDYFDLTIPDHPLYRGLKKIKDKGYLTTRITEEAVSFIQRHKKKPFLLYVAYNANHSPAQAPKEDIKPVTNDKKRNILMAMNKHLDDGVGAIVGTLKKERLFNNTLLVYLTDNGGAKGMNANNAPLRGFKHSYYEGGVRVPFVVSWPARLKGGQKCDVPVSSFDILPTALAAADVTLPKKTMLDGKNMLPVLEGKAKRLHEHLFWSSGGYDGRWAVRSGKWKLVTVKDKMELFDISADISEKTNLASKNPDQVARLKKLYDQWLDQMGEPNSRQPKRWRPGLKSPKQLKQERLRKKKRDERKKKKQEVRKNKKRHNGEVSHDVRKTLRFEKVRFTRFAFDRKEYCETMALTHNRMPGPLSCFRF
ncbi:MAG: sulfatase-like hydrolase/transferase [Gemmataceae bacterium]